MINDFLNGLATCLYPSFLLYVTLIIIILSKLNIGKSSLIRFSLSFISLFIIGCYILNAQTETGAKFLFFAELVLNALTVIFLIWFLLTKGSSLSGKIVLTMFPLIVFALKLSAFSANGYSPEIVYNEATGKFVNVNNFQKFTVYLVGQVLLIFIFIFYGVRRLEKHREQQWFTILKLIITIVAIVSSLFGIIYFLMILNTKYVA
jgi:hypothetical protein